MFKNLTILLSFLAFGYSSVAQEYQLSFGFSDPIIADTTDQYSNLTVQFYVVNTGQNTIYNPIKSLIATNPSDSMFESRLMKTISFSEGSGFLPGDSIFFEAESNYDVVLPSNYFVGDNIIVVWPAIDGNYAYSTENYFHEIYVKNPSDIKENEKLDAFKVFITPSSHIQVESDKVFSQLRLFDLASNEVSYSTSSRVSINNLPSGFYVVHLTFEDGRANSQLVVID
jgi:hypothetical protein